MGDGVGKRVGDGVRVGDGGGDVLLGEGEHWTS